MTDAIAAYFDKIRAYDQAADTEMTLRPALAQLLESMVSDSTTAIQIKHEPARDGAGRGAPDFMLAVNGAIVGYLETKKVGENLDAILKSPQIEKYQRLSHNILLTDYLEWIWLREGEVIARAVLCPRVDAGNRKARLNPEAAEKVTQIIAGFLSVAPEGIARAQKLAPEMAIRCHDLRDYLLEELVRQEREHQKGRLFALFRVFKSDVFNELTTREFADAFAQMLGYGLFLAKLNAGDAVPVTLDNAKRFIPSNFKLIRELVSFLDEMELPEYRPIKWLIEEILSIMNALDLRSLHEDLAFNKSQQRLFAPDEEERLLFAKDPYVYFYEDFLKAYDKETRKGRGVYYTPPPVVNFIVRAVNDVLKDTFGIATGLADHRRVTVLDFATGTGTFLLEVMRQILDDTSAGLRSQVIREHILKNLFGFEYLIAPYTIAHLKLSQFLHESGYSFADKDRLQIFLTNTLEKTDSQGNMLLPALTEEIIAAQHVKDKKILVITGNPPYSGHSKNKGAWISSLIETYKMVDGKPLGEKNPKWLQDDYVKFIRFAQHKMESVEEGIVAVITNHSFLDNPTFRGMRQSLMQTFNRIYLLDLHGNSKKKEHSPDGGKDENVFDIAQGVSISLFIKRKNLPRGIFHADLHGTRKAKYRQLLDMSLTNTDWHKLKPNKPFYLLVPQDQRLLKQYQTWHSIHDIFPVNSVGIVTARDALSIRFSREDVAKTVRDFSSLPPEAARQKYDLGVDARDWKVELAQQDLLQDGLNDKSIVPIAYRPFDERYTYYTGHSKGFHCMPRGEVMRHMLGHKNLGITIPRQVKSGDTWQHVSISDKITESTFISNRTSEIGYLFPLYLYPVSYDKKPKASLLSAEDAFAGRERIENISPSFRKALDKKYGHAYAPEEILGYIYAVLHSPRYRRRYAEFLKTDFPRIPFAEDRATFDRLSALGQDLIAAHLLHKIPSGVRIEASSLGDFTVGKPVYDSATKRLFINPDKYFSPVPVEAWEFCIGGYQVLDKYLKSRRDRALSLDEITHFIHTIAVLAFTHQQMHTIDECMTELLAGDEDECTNT